MIANDNLRTMFVLQQNSRHTRASYERGLAVFADFTNDKPYDQVTDADLIAWKQSLSDLSPNSQFTRWTAVRSMFRWLVKSGRLPFSPFDAVKGPQKTKNVSPRIPATEAYTKIVNIDAKECVEPRDWRDRAIMRVLGTGLRISEVAGLKKDDFFPVPEYGVSALRVIGKGNKERIVPLNETTSRTIYEWLIQRPFESNMLFYDPWGEPMTPRQVQSAVERRCDRLGVPRVNPHSLRHHYATRLIRAGADVFTVQKLLGHASVSTTQIYINLDMGDTVRASKLDTT